MKDGALLDTGAVAGAVPLESETGLGEPLEGLKAGEEEPDDGALVGPADLTAGFWGPGLTCLRLFLERPLPIDTRLKSVR